MAAKAQWRGNGALLYLPSFRDLGRGTGAEPAAGDKPTIPGRRNRLLAVALSVLH